MRPLFLCRNARRLCFVRFGNHDPVAPVELGPVKRGIRRLQRQPPIARGEDVGNPGGKGHLPDRQVGRAIDQSAVSQLGPQPIKFFECVVNAGRPEQYDKFLAPVPGDMAALVGNSRKVLGHQLERPGRRHRGRGCR